MWLMWWALARPAETTEAEWTEFDLDNALWTIPSARMKAQREHVIPLPFQAVNMLRTLQVVLIVHMQPELKEVPV